MNAKKNADLIAFKDPNSYWLTTEKIWKLIRWWWSNKKERLQELHNQFYESRRRKRGKKSLIERMIHEEPNGAESQWNLEIKFIHFSQTFIIVTFLFFLIMPRVVFSCTENWNFSLISSSHYIFCSWK